MPGTLLRRPFGPFIKGAVDSADASLDLSGSLRRARGVIFSGVGKFKTRPGSRLAMTLFDDQGTPALVTSVCAIVPFADGALAVAHSTVTNKTYLYRLAPDLTGWYNAAGVLQANTNAQPVGALWTAIPNPPDVLIAEGLGLAYIAHTTGADGSTLVFPTKQYTTPGTIATLTSDLDGAGGAEDLYFLGVVSFQQHLWGWGFGSGTVVANTYRPELARFSQPNFATPFKTADSITVGDRVRSQREKIVGGCVAGEALFLGTPFSLTRVTGYGRASWYKKPLDKSFGFVGPKSMVARGATLYYWSSRGPMRCQEGGNPEPLWPRIDQAVASVANPQKVIAGYDETTDLVMFFYDSGSGVRTWCGYDETREIWVGPDDDIGLVIRGVGSVSPVYASSAATTIGPTGVPSVPSTTSVGATSATASWINGDSSAQSSVEYRRQVDTAWTVAAVVSAGVSSYTITGLISGVAYEWRVAHLKDATYSSYVGPSGATQFTPGSTLNAPSNLTVSQSGGARTGGHPSILVNWTNSGEAGVSTDIELAGPSSSTPASSAYILQQSPTEPTASANLGPPDLSGTYWVRIRHTKSGFTSSSYVGPQTISITLTGEAV